jgi:hypothetical protein
VTALALGFIALGVLQTTRLSRWSALARRVVSSSAVGERFAEMVGVGAVVVGGRVVGVVR